MIFVNPVETAKANGVEPPSYLLHLFAQLPLAKTVADNEALLTWKVNSALPTAHLRALLQRMYALY